MRRFIVLAATLVAVLASALTASASTSRPVPRLAPRAESAAPARHTAVLLAADIAAAKQGAAQAVLTRIVALHTAHLAHVKETAWRSAHAQHLHLLHLRQISLWSARAEAKAAAARLATERPAIVTPRTPVTTGGSPVVARSTYTGGSGFQQCVIARESGGNSQVMNGSGHYGLYQFDAGTWASGGGNPADFGHASVAEQNQVFNSVYAARGSSPWAPSDGCTAAMIKGSGVVHATLMALVRPAATLDAHQLHLLHLAQERAHAVLTAVTSSSRGAAALRWAVANGSGHAYVWGGTGPGYDCSGLAMEAYLHAAGISLPHSTYSMLASSHLIRTYSPAPGDLAFFGTGHVELYVRAGETFGAHDAAQGIGYMSYGGSWAPTAFYRVR